MAALLAFVVALDCGEADPARKLAEAERFPEIELLMLENSTKSKRAIPAP